MRGSKRHRDGVDTGQLWFHHPEMQARVRRADEEIASGRSTRTETPAEAQALLDSLKTEPRQRH
jgi:hypothetical protein